MPKYVQGVVLQFRNIITERNFFLAKTSLQLYFPLFAKLYPLTVVLSVLCTAGPDPRW